MLDKGFCKCFAGVFLGFACQLTFAQEQKLGFDQAVGNLPSGWVIAATNPDGQLAEWQIKTDSAAVSPPQVLSISRILDKSPYVFNLCWTPKVLFLDGSIEVSVRADKGKEDQGGGIIWRVQDADNYYVARYNPKENNFRLYFVKEGIRTQLANADISGIKTGEWFRLKIAHQGNKIDAYLNGKKYLESTDNTFTKQGGFGLWSKADAASSFDDLVVITP
jgi:hypothetical protein